MQYIAALSSHDYLIIVDGSILLLLLLVTAIVVYITAYYDELHPNEITDTATSDVVETPEIYFVNISPFTGITGATMPAMTKGSRITKRGH